MAATPDIDNQDSNEPDQKMLVQQAKKAIDALVSTSDLDGLGEVLNYLKEAKTFLVVEMVLDFSKTVFPDQEPSK